MGKPVEKPVRFVMTENQLQQICEIAGNAAVSAYKSEHEKARKERESRVLNSAKTLVVNYRRFKDMCENSVYDRTTANDTGLEEIMEMMSGKFRDPDFTVLSIKERVAKTRLIMDHVDTMLEVYRKQCETATDPEEARRYRVICSLYISEKPDKAKDIAEREAITISTVYRDVEKACKKLAVLFFGIDGVRF